MALARIGGDIDRKPWHPGRWPQTTDGGAGWPSGIGRGESVRHCGFASAPPCCEGGVAVCDWVVVRNPYLVPRLKI